MLNSWVGDVKYELYMILLWFHRLKNWNFLIADGDLTYYYTLYELKNSRYVLTI